MWGAVRKPIDDEGTDGLYILTGLSSENIKTPHTGTMRISPGKRVWGRGQRPRRNRFQRFFLLLRR